MLADFPFRNYRQRTLRIHCSNQNKLRTNKTEWFSPTETKSENLHSHTFFIRKNSFYRNDSSNGDASEEIVNPELLLIRFAAAFWVNCENLLWTRLPSFENQKSPYRLMSKVRAPKHHLTTKKVCSRFKSWIWKRRNHCREAQNLTLTVRLCILIWQKKTVEGVPSSLWSDLTKFSS